ncbi:MAG TPA: hypothetical protein VGM44_22280 [Polyangiaceae bacterium]|jgi:hypothetical protein
MASAKRDIRYIIDSFSEDLIQIAKDVVREHVERSLTEWQAKHQKVLAKKSVEDERALRNRRALERIERVAARRREREEKKAAERALRLEQRVIAGKKPRARKGGLLGADAKKEPTPPPLFVHKRRRDGEIEQLKRHDEPETGALNGAAQPAVAAT